ncbi:uncharacterized protein TM35_001841010, partial [Trypanosoma theileri]
VSACGKYADLCRQRTARAATTTRITTANAGQPKAVMAVFNGTFWGDVWGSTYPYSSQAQTDHRVNERPESPPVTHLKEPKIVPHHEQKEAGPDPEVELLTQKSQTSEAPDMGGSEDRSHISVIDSREPVAGTLPKRGLQEEAEGTQRKISGGGDPIGSTGGESTVHSLTRTDQETKNAQLSDPSQDGATSHASPSTEKPTTEANTSINSNGATGDNTPIQQQSTESTTGTEGSQENGNADSTANTTTTTTTTTTTLPPELTNNKKGDADSSSSISSSVWMRVPL